MSILLSLILAQAPVLPEIDRRALELQARAEALLSRRATTPAPSRGTAPTAATPPRHLALAAPRPAPRQLASATHRTSVSRIDLSSLTTICRAADGLADPAAFLATLSRAYSLSATESASLRTGCAAYLAGRADARVNYSARAR
jgi:hypothetical protein